MEKRKSPKSEWDSGVSHLGEFKLDHLLPIKMILFKNIFSFLPFILGYPISYYPRERKEGRSRGWEWGKGNHPKVNETQGFLTLGHSNWIICSLLNWFCPKKCPPFYPASHNKPFLNYGEEEGRRQQGLNKGKGIASKVNLYIHYGGPRNKSW